jgi:hypothetical protein
LFVQRCQAAKENRVFGNKKKLSLNKETVRALSGNEMQGLVGGMLYNNARLHLYVQVRNHHMPEGGGLRPVRLLVDCAFTSHASSRRERSRRLLLFADVRKGQGCGNNRTRFTLCNVSSCEPLCDGVSHAGPSESSSADPTWRAR